MQRKEIGRTTFVLFAFNLVAALTASEPALQIAILETQGQFDVAKPFKVEFSNLTDQPIKIHDPRSAEGYRALALVFTHKKTKVVKKAGPIEFETKSEQLSSPSKNDSKPERRMRMLECYSKTLDIVSKDSFHFYVFLNETIEGDRPDVSQIAEWDLQVLYEPQANLDNAWSGRILSKPVQGKLVCSGIDDLKSAIKLSETKTLQLLETNPQWLASLGALEILKLGISNNRPTVVQWAIKHKASPFHMVNKARIESFRNCPAAKIENIDVLKIVWDEMPTRRDDLFRVICEVARHNISNPFRLEVDQQKENLEAMLAWGAKPTLFSAIYLGDFDSVKSMLSNLQKLPDEDRKLQDFATRSQFVWAVACGRFEIAEWLIDQFKLDVNADYQTNGPLLAYAIRTQEMTDLLCKHNASFVDNHASGGYAGFFTWEMDPTAIDFAAAYGAPEVMKTLLENGGDLSYSASEMHPLAIAVHEQNWPVLKFLATHPKFLELDGASRASILADVRNEAMGPRTIRSVVSKGKLEALSFLETPESLRNGLQEKVNLLLDSDGSLDDPRATAARSLMRISLEMDLSELVIQLLDAGYDKQIGYADFLIASCSGNLNLLQIMAERCSSDFESSKDGLLREAAARGDFVTSKWLLDRGADPRAEDKRGWDALDATREYTNSITTAEVERLIHSKEP